jgi:hypothetical protein
MYEFFTHDSNIVKYRQGLSLEQTIPRSTWARHSKKFMNDFFIDFETKIPSILQGLSSKDLQKFGGSAVHFVPPKNKAKPIDL